MNERSINRRFRFSLRTVIELMAFAVLVLILIYIRIALLRSSGRYQLHTKSESSDLWVIDTQTGHVWHQVPSSAEGLHWIDEGVPPDDAKQP